jgi:hypothetical protein
MLWEYFWWNLYLAVHIILRVNQWKWEKRECMAMGIYLEMALPAGFFIYFFHFQLLE